MLPACSKFPSQSVQTWHVFHDTNGPNHGITLKTLWFFLKETCTDTHLLVSCGRDSSKKSHGNLNGKKAPNWECFLFIENEDSSCRSTWKMFFKWTEAEYGSHVEENRRSMAPPRLCWLARRTAPTWETRSGSSWKNVLRRTIKANRRGTSAILRATIRFRRDIATIRARPWVRPPTRAVRVSSPSDQMTLPFHFRQSHVFRSSLDAHRLHDHPNTASPHSKKMDEIRWSWWTNIISWPRIQGVSPHWGFMLTQAPIWGNRGWETIFLFHAPVSLDWGTFRLTPLCTFPNFPRLWLRVGVALFPQIGGSASAKGLKSWCLLSLVSPDWGLFLQIGVVHSKNHLFRACDVQDNWQFHFSF